MTRVRTHETFRADVRAQIAWLRRHRDASWVTGLRDGLREARVLLGRYPGAGSLLEDREGAVLRKLVLRRQPFNVLYVHDGMEVHLLQLFHHRQARPA